MQPFTMIYKKGKGDMFGDVAMITIWVSLNMAIMTLTMFMYHIGRSSREEDWEEEVVNEKRTD